LLETELAFPAYAAMRVYFPEARVAVESVATPEAFSVAVPSSVAPFMKMTVPAGVTVLAPFTVAVKVNAWPATTGFGEATRPVVVAWALTDNETAGDVLMLKLSFPVYSAEKLYAPTANDAVDSVAAPDAFKATVPNTVLPLKNVTEPAGTVAPVECTVAVRATAWPTVTAPGDTARLVVVD
jgi:hypothetical protein